MPEASELAALGLGSIVAPAGHGKTEIIGKIAALGGRALVLTHTHAGVHAIRARLRRMKTPAASVAVDTVAGWCMRYAHAFPAVARPPAGMPRGDAEWRQLYAGATAALRLAPVRAVVAASYDRVLIDEYQDCNRDQHVLAMTLSELVPTMIFGDPMQGIFEFAGATLRWSEEVHPRFPLRGSLDTPHRWAATNPDLGAWVAETRVKLARGEPIDLWDGRISFRPTDSAFDMGALFEPIEGKEGSCAAIHCSKVVCYQLASAARGGYQAIEEIAAGRLGQFAEEWDASEAPGSRRDALLSLSRDCFNKRELAPGEATDPSDAPVVARLRELGQMLGGPDGAAHAASLMSACRELGRWKLYRGGLWRDAERAALEVAQGRCASMAEAADVMRQRASLGGRKLPIRTVSTPLLLKGLEFDHVVVPDASHFLRQSSAQAKLFYVAISRATRTLTISSQQRYLQFPTPDL